MKRKLKLIVSAFMILFAVGAMAQTTKKPAAVPPLTKEQSGEEKKKAADLYKAGNYKEAIVSYTRLVNYDPEDMDYNYKLGMSYLNSNVDKSQGVQYFVK